MIALPGETVQTKDGSIYIDNRKLNEPYLPKGTSSRYIDTPVTVPAGQVWVMGDNRANSADSRGLRPDRHRHDRRPGVPANLAAQSPRHPLTELRSDDTGRP